MRYLMVMHAGINFTILHDPWYARLSSELLPPFEGWEHIFERRIGENTVGINEL